MKLWEVIKALTEDPTKKFEATLGCTSNIARMRAETGVSTYFKFEVFDGSRLIEQSCNAGAFNGNVALGLDWHEVKQPVTWQEAIQAWADGKKVVWEEDAERRVFDRNKSWTVPIYQSHLIDQDGDAVKVRMISGGKWYVEDVKNDGDFVQRKAD